MTDIIKIGLDIGSTTIKLVALSPDGTLKTKAYTRHHSSIYETLLKILREVQETLNNETVTASITGSGGFSVAEKTGLPFVQEVVAGARAIEDRIPQTDVAIELGGEDAKITFFSEVLEQRMNGTCAGGTGSFIDQMASLLQTDAAGLNELAKKAQTIYPIASRCGVFAKSDVQPLINDGARKEDIAASILQAVVNQTIAGLSQGKAITGKVALLGGPLAFLSELRKAFIQTLDLSTETALVPEDGQYFVAIGAALHSENGIPLNFSDLVNHFESLKFSFSDDKNTLPPLFSSAEDKQVFDIRHARAKAGRADLSAHQGPAFLGIDAGSTTTKLVLIDDKGAILWSHYGSNQGNPLDSVRQALKNLYKELNPATVIAYSTVTGYGEALIKNALRVDHGEIETVCHVSAARHFQPEVDFVLDIGGQDMKSMRLKNGAIDTIMLNEACSSGCGSFIETFAKAVQLDVASFAALGTTSKTPVDLGTRCTVFMNSRVKQAQKEGASPADISAGISLSVIKNALFKVIRLRSSEELGKYIVVQGGTFYNDSVLRAMEIVSGREVVRPDVAGLMGAFGSALISRERYQEGFQSTLLSAAELSELQLETTIDRCPKCQNHCLLTTSVFNGERSFTTGNRCERGAGLDTKKEALPNLFDWKFKRLFRYRPLSLENAPRGAIGIPRTLNMYEDYPFWFTFFTSLGYRVELSRKSSHKLFEEGMHSIPSESVCYPAKLAHGHVKDLLSRGISKIFYPCVPYLPKEDQAAGNHYSCPIVTSYPETLRVNMDELKQVRFLHPFLPLDHKERLIRRLAEELSSEHIDPAELRKAIELAYAEQARLKSELKEAAEEALIELRRDGKKAIVLAGRPYHLDEEVHHGISDLLTSLGFGVLTEDSVAHLGFVERPLRVVDQWVYHNRLYRAASFVASQPDLELVQLVSFGCGLDAVTADQVKEILEQYGKLYTQIKIDEISNLGAVKIRLRSLAATLKERERRKYAPEKLYELPKPVVFSKEMRQTHTILAPQMSPIHFSILEQAMSSEGYKLKILPSVDKHAIDVGLRYVHNDACYPTIITVGQIMNALLSGDYDLKSTAVIISQTGGGCRATNYIAFIKKALRDAGLSEVPVISLNASGLEKQPGFSLGPSILQKMVESIIYGDLLMRVLYKVRPYEQVPGSANALYETWDCRLRRDITTGRNFRKNIRAIIDDFESFAIDETLKKPKVGVVGEILVKYHPTANNNLVELLEAQGAEAVVPDLLDFFLYSAYTQTFRHQKLSGTRKSKFIGDLSMAVIQAKRSFMEKALNTSKRFHPPANIKHLGDLASTVLSLGNMTGEGWFLTAEMMELIEDGVDNILCLQPFACLPNHITGKGMIKGLRERYPTSNIVPIDYDPGASEVNQLNRIKLMLTTANRHLLKDSANN